MAKKSIAKSKPDHPYSSVNSWLDKLSSLKKLKSSKKFYIALVIAGLLALAIYKKEWFVAATVNGAPITNLELQMRLNKQFRTQTLNQLINEKIILSELTKNNAVPTEAEVSKKISDIETSLGGPQAMDAILAQQGQTRESVRQQLKLQLGIEKLYANEATVSAEEVAEFIEINKDQMRASESAEQQKEAAESIKNQKVTQIFSQKFPDLRQKAKIQIF